MSCVFETGRACATAGQTVSVRWSSHVGRRLATKHHRAGVHRRRPQGQSRALSGLTLSGACGRRHGPWPLVPHKRTAFASDSRTLELGSAGTRHGSGQADATADARVPSIFLSHVGNANI